MTKVEILQAFYPIISILLTIIGYMAVNKMDGFQKSLDRFGNCMETVKESIGELNTNVAVIVEKTERNTSEIVDIQSKYEKTRERMHDLANDINGINARIEIMKD